MRSLSSFFVFRYRRYDNVIFVLASVCECIEHVGIYDKWKLRRRKKNSSYKYFYAGIKTAVIFAKNLVETRWIECDAINRNRELTSFEEIIITGYFLFRYTNVVAAGVWDRCFCPLSVGSNIWWKYVYYESSSNVNETILLLVI